MPAPTTRTSKSATWWVRSSAGSRESFMRRRVQSSGGPRRRPGLRHRQLLYRPVSLQRGRKQGQGTTDSMAIVQKKWSALPVPFAIETPDRVPKERYYDPDFYRLESELLWPRTWQMACRLEEIPQPGDYAEYEILDQSIVVVRITSDEVKAYYNTCRHRAVKLIEGHGTCEQGFVCSFHGWCYGLDGANTYVLRP